MTDKLPPLPDLGWSCLCTKCGNTWEIDKPQKSADCQCGYAAFVVQNKRPTVEQMQDYARQAVREAFIKHAGVYIALTDAMGYESGEDGLEFSPEEWAEALLRDATAHRKAVREAVPEGLENFPESNSGPAEDAIELFSLLELEAEGLEQARIIGMGAERELALMARVSGLEAALEQVKAVLNVDDEHRS